MNMNETKGVVTKTISLTNHFKSTNQKRISELSVVGGMCSDGELAWVYNGPILKITNVSDGTLVSSWDFTTITRDNRTKIADIIEYTISEQSNRACREVQIYFIVAYTSKRDINQLSYLSICHSRTSQILHTITTKERISRVALISAKKEYSAPLNGIVKLMSGALAVGTKDGNILIVDIREMLSGVRRSYFDRVENRISEMLVLDLKHNNENTIKDRLDEVDKLHHIAVSLPVTGNKNDQEQENEITALKYLPQCMMLAVGFKSGVFQLWSVSEMKRLHKSSHPGVPTPVVKFGFQEPCNDPQNICYLWVLYEASSDHTSCLPFAIMYGCVFKKITNVPEYGRYYKSFMHCKKRFDIDVDLERCVNGRCIACSVVSNTQSNILRHVATIDEDASKINLFVIAFETWERDTQFSSFVTLVVFDMNQWYKAQMPPQIYQGYSVPFVNFQILDQISRRKCTVLDMRIKKDSIQQFLSFNLSEEYSYPSSLSLDSVFLTDTKIVYIHIPGAQRNVLEKIVADGPFGIINPSKYYSECKEVGLRPCFSDSYSHLAIPTQLQQRNFVLTVLLEHKLSTFLVCCVKEWYDGSLGVSGCTLSNLIQWAWECASRIKQLTDTICIPLFDYSGDDLDRENYQKLKHCVQLIHTIRDLLAYILKNYKQYLLDDTKLKHQVEMLKLITRYFDSIIWCLDSNLLPEKVISSSEKCVPTYMMSIMQYTEQRRAELKNIILEDQYFLTENKNLYIIDEVFENERHGRKLLKQWERESGGISGGSYLPVTLQSLLRMFLMGDISLEAKNFIMVYFLLDVCDYHRDEDMKEQLLSFPTVFSLNTGFFSMVQACWFIDHEKFEEAAVYLLTDTVLAQFKKEQHLYRTLILACVCQGQYAIALRCERFAKLSYSVFKSDTFFVTLLLLNGLVMEAYTTLKNRGFTHKELLRHFFKVCDNLGYLKEVFRFPLSVEEEEEFIEYLDSCKNKDVGDLKVMYLLSRARYVEAIDFNYKLSSTIPKHGIIGHDTTKQNNGAGRTTTRDLLVNAFSKTLPSVTNDLINFYRKERNKISRFKAVTKPTPLSVVVHTDTSSQIPTYKSSFESVLEAAICKTAETWSNVPEMLKNKRICSSLNSTPFLRSDIMTPCRNKMTFSDRGMSIHEEKEKNVNEPPEKKPKLDNLVGDLCNDTFCQEGYSTPPAEVSKILCTPHIQKRLNKLLQSTPESSPLTSILKSSDMSRFKQPQKVEFTVPEKGFRRSERKRTHSEKSNEPSITKKYLNFEPSTETYTESTSRSITTADVELSPETSLDNSYYSLDGDDESPNISDFIKEQSMPATLLKSVLIENENEVETTESGCQLAVQCLSEEDITEPHRQITIECMSEEELNESHLKRTMECMSEEEMTPQPCAQPTNECTSFEKTPEKNVISQVEVYCETSPKIVVEEPPRVESSDHAILPEFMITDSYSVFAPSLPIQTIIESKTEKEVPEMFEAPRQEYLDNSLTEIKDEVSDDDDSDIEIVDDVPAKIVVTKENMNDASTVENDVMSEKSYDSECSYSRLRVPGESYDEESLQDEDEEEIEEDRNMEEEYQEEAEEEYEYDEDEEEIDVAEDDVGRDEEASNAESEDISESGKDDEIDYDMLKMIMSTVRRAEGNEELVNGEVIGEQSTPQPSASAEMEPDTSVEVVSVSCVEKEQESNEPPLVFYFGENSVASIGEELMTDESAVEQPESKKTDKNVSGDEEVPEASKSGQEPGSNINESQLKLHIHTTDTYGNKLMCASASDGCVEPESNDDVETIGIEKRSLYVDDTFSKSVEKVNDVESSNNEITINESYLLEEVGEQAELNLSRRIEVNESAEVIMDYFTSGENDHKITKQLGSNEEEIFYLESSPVVPPTEPVSCASNDTLAVLDSPCLALHPLSVTTGLSLKSSPKDTSSGQMTHSPPCIFLPTSPQRSTNNTPVTGSPILAEEASPHMSPQHESKTSPDKSPLKCSVASLLDSTSQSSFREFPVQGKESPSLITVSSSSTMNGDGNPATTFDSIPHASPTKTSPVPSKGVQRSPQKVLSTEMTGSSEKSRMIYPDLTVLRKPERMSQKTLPENLRKDQQHNFDLSPRRSPTPSGDKSPSSERPQISSTQLTRWSHTKPGSPLAAYHRSRSLKSDSHDHVLRSSSMEAQHTERAESISSFDLSMPDSPLSENNEIVRELPSTPTNQITVTDPSLTQSRRSARIARRLCKDPISQAMAEETAPANAGRLSRKRRSTGSSHEVTSEDDDAMSVISGTSITSRATVESGMSTASSKEQRDKRSFSRLEMRKTSVRPHFKRLEVIVSDEELKSPTKSELQCEVGVPNESRYASSEPGGRTGVRKWNKGGASNDDDRLSSVSETSGSRWNRGRSLSSEVNAEICYEPNPLRKSGPKMIVCSTLLAGSKVNKKRTSSKPSVSDYTDSRRLTRYQKSLLQYEIKRAANRDDATHEHQIVDKARLGNDYTTSESELEEPVIAPRNSSATESMKQPNTRAAIARSRKKSISAIGANQILERHVRDLKNRNDIPAVAGSENSDESCSSRTSSTSRRSKKSRSSFTHLELRKSTSRPQFKPLSVIPSDEESLSLTPKKSITDDESIKSSSQRRSVRLMKNESEQSDRESEMSDLSSSSAVHSSRRSTASVEAAKRTSATKRHVSSRAVSEDGAIVKRARKNLQGGNQQRTSRRKK